MSYADFEVGIWHPFGPHGLETSDQIIERKRREIEANGWTFWSFQYRQPAVLDEWSARLGQNSKAIVFCSNSPGAKDPSRTGNPVGTRDCQSYRYARQTEWRPWPKAVRVPHPFRGRRTQASAFVVQRIAYPIEPFELPSVEWLYRGNWRADEVPSRGEYLVRRGGAIPLRAIRAILELREPYLATVSANAAQQTVPADGPASRARG